jgi:PAS domain S-box-containing protein
MASDLRQTGISVVGDVPWGTHFCLFYQSSQDLVDTLVPYFEAGLKSNEFCLCMVAQHLAEQDVTRPLGQAIPDLGRYFANRAIEIVRPENLYLGGAAFDARHTTRYLHEKLEHALSAGFSGMRANGDEAWLRGQHWPDFSEYERALGDAIGGSRMLVLCAYPLETSRPGQILDVAQAHEYLVAKRGEDWELLETAALKQTKQELKALSGELERRVAARTSQLQETIEQLGREITRRKRVEEELVEKEAKYRRLFETSRDVILFMDITGNILDINPSGAQITGFTHDELRGMNALRDLLVPADHGTMREVLKHVQKGRTPRYQVRWKTKDGRIVEFDGISIARRSADGKFISTFCSLRDMTMRKHVERALIASEERFAKAFRSSPIANTITRAADGRFMDVNDAFVRIFGYERGEVIGRTALELSLWTDPESRPLLMKKLQDQGRVQGIEARARTKFGDTLELLVFGDVIELGGEQCLLVSGYDQTARKHAEHALRAASEQLKALSRRLVEIQEAERRQLARELHDRVGQNLTALGINLDIVTARLAGRGDGEVSSRLEDSIALLEATADAIVNVLSELRPPMLDDLGLLPALEWYAKEFSTLTGVDVSVAGEDQMRRAPPEAEIALFRIAQEALNNVAKHARARNVDIELTSNGEWVLTVSDDGVGLDRNPQPESRPSSTFGMVTMRERALAIGGRFEICPRPGGGTSVVVRLPSP